MRILGLTHLSFGLLLMTSCNLNPTACLEMEEIYEVDRQYQFSSCSEDYEFVTWEFGDGTGFLGNDAVKTFGRKGDFTVSVKAYANGAYGFDEATADIKAANRIIDRFTITGNSVYESFRLINSVNGFDFSEVYPNATGNFTPDAPFEAELQDEMRTVLPVGISSFELTGIRTNGQPIDLIDITSRDFEDNLDNPFELRGKGFVLSIYWVYE